jgi:hypothetical protein
MDRQCLKFKNITLDIGCAVPSDEASGRGADLCPPGNIDTGACRTVLTGGNDIAVLPLFPAGMLVDSFAEHSAVTQACFTEDVSRRKPEARLFQKLSSRRSGESAGGGAAEFTTRSSSEAPFGDVFDRSKRGPDPVNSPVWS